MKLLVINTPMTPSEKTVAENRRFGLSTNEPIVTQYLHYFGVSVKLFGILSRVDEATEALVKEYSLPECIVVTRLHNKSKGDFVRVSTLSSILWLRNRQPYQFMLSKVKSGKRYKWGLFGQGKGAIRTWRRFPKNYILDEIVKTWSAEDYQAMVNLRKAATLQEQLSTENHEQIYS